jgi:hypothetical protein
MGLQTGFMMVGFGFELWIFKKLFLDETRRYPRVFPNCSFQPFMEVSDISGEFSPCKNGP